MKDNYDNYYKNVAKKIKEEDNKKAKNYRCEKCLRILLSSIEFKEKITIHNSCDFCENSNYINSLDNFQKKCFSLESSICRKCGKLYGTKKNNKEEKFYYCFNCSLILCHFCHRKHKELHKTFSKIQQFDSICQKHNYPYTNFCDNCNKSLCPDCVIDHNTEYNKKCLEHNIKSLSELFIEEDDLKKYEKIIDDEIKLLNIIKEITNKILYEFNNMINKMKNIYNIYINNLENIIDIHKTILQFYSYAAINQDMCYEQMKSFKNFFNVSNNIKELIERVNCNNENLLVKYKNLINFLTDNNNYIIKSSDDLEKRKNDFNKNIIQSENTYISNKLKQVNNFNDEQSTKSISQE